MSHHAFDYVYMSFLTLKTFLTVFIKSHGCSCEHTELFYYSVRLMRTFLLGKVSLEFE